MGLCYTFNEIFFQRSFQNGGKNMAITETAAHRRIASLLDEQSFVEIGSRVVSRLADSDPSLEKQGDGVVCGYGTIGGALVYV